MRRLAAGALLAVAPALSVGCGGEGSGLPEATVRDSAGVTIVENPAEAVAAAPAWRLAPDPELDVGVVEGDSVYQLDDVNAAVRLSDGAVAVADGGSSQIRVYGPDGRFRFAAAGAGEGPGEFRRLSRLYRLPGDSLLAYDGRLDRISVFSPEGAFVRSEPLETEDGDRATLVDRLADGIMVVSGNRVITDVPGTGVHRYPRTYRLRSIDGSTDSLLTLPGSEFHLQSSGNAIRITQLPFARGNRVEAGGEHVYAGVTDRFEIRKYDVDGTLERLIRLDRPLRPVTEADVERMLDARTASASDEDEARETRKRLREIDLPETMPAFGGLEADAAGNLWVEEYAPPGTEANDWIVFGPDGAVVATVELPPRFEPLEIGEDYVLGRWRDELDVEHLRHYRLRRDAEGSSGSGAGGS